MGGYATEPSLPEDSDEWFLQGAEIGSISLNEVAGKLKLVNENHDLIVQDKRMGICFGKKQIHSFSIYLDGDTPNCSVKCFRSVRVSLYLLFRLFPEWNTCSP